MKELLVGGGLVDFATLHPLGTAVVLGALVLVARRLVRSLGAGRRPPGSQSPRRDGASHLV